MLAQAVRRPAQLINTLQQPFSSGSHTFAIVKMIVPKLDITMAVPHFCNWHSQN